MDKKASANLILNILFNGVVVPFGLSMLSVPPLFIVAVAVISMALVLLWGHTSHELGWRRRLLPALTMIFGTVAFLIGAAWFYYQAPRIAQKADPTSAPVTKNTRQVAEAPPPAVRNDPGSQQLAGPIAVAPRIGTPARLTRSISFTRLEPNFATPPSGERLLDSYGISLTNTGNDMVRPRLVSFSLTADGKTLLASGEQTTNFLAGGETQAIGINPISGKRIPLPSDTNEMLAEIRLDYDTVPPTGVRHVYRKVRHVIHWPEEGRSLWIDASILAEEED